MRRSLVMRHLPPAIVLGVAATLRAGMADASCNTIPMRQTTFLGALARVDRPFARPGDWVELQLDPACHARSTGVRRAAEDQVVTLIFEPPAGPRSIVALATDCEALAPALAACEARADVRSVTCATVNLPGAPPSLLTSVPDRLRFRFPDTDALMLDADDGATLSGPVTIAVSPRGTVPCQLAGTSCTTERGLLACVDQIFAEDGTCGRTPSRTFPSFTALPPPNDYQALCTEPVPPCTGRSNDLRFAIDADGNMLIPVDWRGVLVDRDAVPVARLLRGSSAIEAFEGRGAPIVIPDAAVLGSYSPEGSKLPPIFDPQVDPTDVEATTLFGTADAPETVLRIARHEVVVEQCAGGPHDGLPCVVAADCPGGSCTAPTCRGGSSHGAACTADDDCPAGECGPGLFDFSGRLAAGGGSVVLRLGACIGGATPLAACGDDADCGGGQCGRFRLAALDPVPLDGLNQSEEVNAFVIEEAIAERDLNGDGDAVDPVVKLADRMTGTTQAIGDGGSEGRAIVRVREPPFSFPALAVEGDVVAFLEPEPLQGGTDANGNGIVFETLLRAFRLGSPGFGDLLSGVAPAVDAAPVIDGRSVVLSDGVLVFRRSEAAEVSRELTRVSVPPAGGAADGPSSEPALSADGRHVAFVSLATNLVPGDTNGVADVFVHDRGTGALHRVSVSSAGEQGNGPSGKPVISGDGRVIAFLSTASNLVPDDANQCSDIVVGLTDLPADERASRIQSHTVRGPMRSCRDVLVHDRDADGNGVFDEPGGVTTVRVSVTSDGDEPDADSHAVRLTTDGRYVAFSNASQVLHSLGDGPCRELEEFGLCTQIFVHDRATGETSRIPPLAEDEPAATRVGDAWNMSRDDGTLVFDYLVIEEAVFDRIDEERFVVVRARFEERSPVAHDRTTRSTEPLDLPPSFRLLECAPLLSWDGRLMIHLETSDVRFADRRQSFLVHDRLTGVTSALPPPELAGLAPVRWGSGCLASVSADGRHVGSVTVEDRNIVLLGGPPGLFVQPVLYDRLTHLARPLGPPHSDPTTLEGPRNAPVGVALSRDGETVAFGTAAALDASDTNETSDIAVEAPRTAEGDLTGDGDARDTVLAVLDVDSGASTDLCPATLARTAAGRVAFLRPEDAGPTPALPHCPDGVVVGGLPDLNGDGDASDRVVHFWSGTGPVTNLGLAARDLALSEHWIAALAVEAAHGGLDLNGDGDASDDVVHVHPAGGGSWLNLGQAADALGVSASLLAFSTPEAAQAGADLNRDGDAEDRVLQVYDASVAPGQVVNLGQQAQEFVSGDAGLVAFRTNEARQGGTDLNGDGDATDDVLQVYDHATGSVLNSGQAARPCLLEACDPRAPYRVLDDTVRFLTLEAEQGEDLNGDGDTMDLVLQVLNVRRACHTGSLAGACHALAGVSAGICTDTGESCANDAACPDGTCFVPPGGCVLDLGTSCDPRQSFSCPSGQFCRPTPNRPGEGTCNEVQGTCGSSRDCVAPATCQEGRQTFQRLVDPLLRRNAGALVFTGSGRCVEDLATACATSEDCLAGEFCDGGSCRREHGACEADEDCPLTSICVKDLIAQTAEDRDGDEIPDVVDNCPEVPNVLQEDADGDGAGDDCDRGACGDGMLDPGEECDDGNLVAGDGCEPRCTLTERCTRPLTTRGSAIGGGAIRGESCEPRVAGF